MMIDEIIKRFNDNADYERTHGNLQGCLAFRQLAEWLTELKQLREQKWIPVSEILPEDNLKVFVSTKTAVGIAAHNELGWYTPDTYFDGVIAWMPLPEPFKEEGSDANDTR